jgi:hypothetical protein
MKLLRDDPSDAIPTQRQVNLPSTREQALAGYLAAQSIPGIDQFMRAIGAIMDRVITHVARLETAAGYTAEERVDFTAPPFTVIRALAGCDMKGDRTPANLAAYMRSCDEQRIEYALGIARSKDRDTKRPDIEPLVREHPTVIGILQPETNGAMLYEAAEVEKLSVEELAKATLIGPRPALKAADGPKPQAAVEAKQDHNPPPMGVVREIPREGDSVLVQHEDGQRMWLPLQFGDERAGVSFMPTRPGSIEILGYGPKPPTQNVGINLKSILDQEPEKPA